MASLVSLSLGSQTMSPPELSVSVLRMIGRAELDTQGKILYHLRLPRLFLGLFAGAGLALSGTAMQGITRNPLVSPFTLGLSSAASFGASLAIVFNLTPFPGTRMGVVATAFGCALLCALVVFLIAGKAGLSPVTLVLTGLALSYLFSALSAGVQFVSQEYQLSAVVSWTFGSLNGAQWSHTAIPGILLLTALPVLLFIAWPLNVMHGNDDEVAKSLGVHPRLIRMISGGTAVLLTAAIISFTGVIGFIGLVAPHISRMLVGVDHRHLLPHSAIVGALLLVVGDTLGRTILAPVQIPVGIIVSFLGVPLFLHLILRSGNGAFE
ncbi:MAG: iron ABC transporter permease [Spirochaetaceae bacterium]|nr:MAG: iron ABC transporter permease [Spirochaetaceae bacterium]